MISKTEVLNKWLIILIAITLNDLHFNESLIVLERELSTWSRDPRGPTDGGRVPDGCAAAAVSLTGWADSDLLDFADEPRTGGGAVRGRDGR